MLDLAAVLLLSAAAPDAEPPLATLGTVTVVMIGRQPGTTDPAFSEAVGQALGEANFTLVPQRGHSRYVAEVSVEQRGRGVVAAKAPTGPAQAGVGSWGPAISIPLATRKTQLHDLVLTTLTVRIVAAADHRPVWTGSAVTAEADGTPAVALKLARAVVAAYPRPLMEPISVP